MTRMRETYLGSVGWVPMSLAVCAFALLVPHRTLAQSDPGIEVSVAPGGQYQSAEYLVSVKIDNQWVPSHTYALTGPWQAQPQLHTLCSEAVTVHWTKIMTGQSEIELRVSRLSGLITDFDLSPSRYGIAPDRITGTGASWLSFRARVDEKIWVDLKDDRNLLFIFVQPPKPAVPVGAEYFGPGVHTIGTHAPTASSVYLDNGAWVKGVLWFDATHAGIEVVGPGVLSGEDFPWYQSGADGSTPECMHNDDPGYFMPLCMICPKNPVDWKDHILSGDVRIDGPTLVKSPMFNYYLFAEGSIDIRNTEILAIWNYNTDGFWVRSFGQASRIENSFVLNNDDALHLNNVRSWTDEVNDDPRFDSVPYDTSFENMVVASRAPFLLGYGYHELPVGSVASARHTDVIMADLVGTGGGGAVFHAIVDGCSSAYADGNITVNDVRIEDGQVPRLLQASVRSTYLTSTGALKATYPASGSQYMTWGCGRDLGQLENVTLHGIDLLEGQNDHSVLYSKDASNQVRGFALNNVRIAGSLLTAANESDHIATHDLVERSYNTTQCRMFIPTCHNPAKWFGDNAWVTYSANNAGNANVDCASETVAMAEWCNLGPTEPMYSKFEWNFTYVAPGDHTIVNGPIDDTDQDIIADAFDNCIVDRNPDQADGDGDGVGDVCDANEGLTLHKVSMKGSHRPNRGGAKLEGFLANDSLLRAARTAGMRLRIASLGTPTLDEVAFVPAECRFRDSSDGGLDGSCRTLDGTAKISFSPARGLAPQHRIKATLGKRMTGNGLGAGPVQVDLFASTSFATAQMASCSVSGRFANSIRCR